VVQSLDIYTYAIFAYFLTAAISLLTIGVILVINNVIARLSKPEELS
jgi:hypothetical protein